MVVDGYRVPYLSAQPIRGGKVLLTLDSRFMVEVEVADMEWLVEFMANCIAVASGYTCHPGTDGVPTPIKRDLYRRSVELLP